MHEATTNTTPNRPPSIRPRWYARRWFKVTAALFALGCLALALTTEYLIRNAAPILRKRIIQTLSARFNAPVELDTLDISLLRGIEVTGTGLRIPYGADANARMPGSSAPASTTSAQPHIQLSAARFTFRSTLHDLLHSPTHIATVYADGIVIDLPPGSRASLLGPNQRAEAADPEHPATVPKIALIVSLIRCTNVKLLIEPADPTKQPHQLDIQSLILHKLSGPMQYAYDAELTNPVPRGQVHATGHLGPWNINQPRLSPLDGDYTFNADLSTIKGISGTLNATGHFTGVLDRIAIDGDTDTPNFALDISNHPAPLHTLFHALVDGTTGDTTLQQVQARLGRSDLTCSGTIMNIKGRGHDIALTTAMPHGRIEDLLELGMKSSQPLLTGTVNLRASLHIPPGRVRIAQKLQLTGQLAVTDVQFTKSKFQDRIDDLSLRAQGRPDQANTAATDRVTEARSALATNVTLANGELTFNQVRYQVPGVLVLLDGVDSLDGNLYEFKGHVRIDATASQMVTGWKRMLLRPLDPLLSRNGAGTELPISVSGQRNDVHLGLAFNDANETTTQMSQDLKTKRQQPINKLKPR